MRSHHYDGQDKEAVVLGCRLCRELAPSVVQEVEAEKIKRRQFVILKIDVLQSFVSLICEK